MGICLLLFSLPVSGQAWAQKAEVLTKQEGGVPRVFLLEGRQLQITRQRIHNGDKSFAQALAKLESDAQKALAVEKLSVTVKQALPPSGDKHDYMSQAPYFWANPQTPNGLPYIRRDGERNPEINKYPDHENMDRMVAAVETLALAYYFKGNEAYATKAAELLRVWFLDEATRMNANLQFAQAIPGINTGRGIGLIETRGLTRLLDAIGLLAISKVWTDRDQRGLQEWFAKFLQWMLESKNGRDEAASKNNHGSFYDLQTASFALFTGKTKLAADILQTVKQKRIALQIEPDGSQPLEMERTRSWSYSVFNLEALVQLATLGEKVGVDLWNYQTTDGRGMRKAFDYLMPFAFGERKWTYKQLGEWQPQALFPLMRQAASRYKDAQYQVWLAKVPTLDAADRKVLLSAKPQEQKQTK
jgi:hypothetical protein